MLEVARAMVERALVEEERGLVELASGLQLFDCNLSTGGIPAGKSAERFLKDTLVSEYQPSPLPLPYYLLIDPY